MLTILRLATNIWIDTFLESTVLIVAQIKTASHKLLRCTTYGKSMALLWIALHIDWVVPLPSNSHHQDYYISSRVIPIILHLPLFLGRGDNPTHRLYHGLCVNMSISARLRAGRCPKSSSLSTLTAFRRDPIYYTCICYVMYMSVYIYISTMLPGFFRIHLCSCLSIPFLYQFIVNHRVCDAKTMFECCSYNDNVAVEVTTVPWCARWEDFVLQGSFSDDPGFIGSPFICWFLPVFNYLSNVVFKRIQRSPKKKQGRVLRRFQPKLQKLGVSGDVFF